MKISTLAINFIILFVVALFTTACGNAPTPDPTEIAKIAGEAVKATLTAQPTPTSVPATDTPIPPTETPKATSTSTTAPTAISTNTPLPTATASPTPYSAVIPVGWVPYELISGNALITYPPKWQIHSEYERAVLLDAGDGIVVTVGDMTEKEDADRITGYEEQIRLLKEWDLTSDGYVKFIDEGTLDLPGNRAYVVSSSEKSGIRVISASTTVTDGENLIAISILSPGDSLPEDTIDMLTDLARAVQFKPYTKPTPTPTLAPNTAVKVVKKANLRAGPGTNYQIAGSIQPGDDLEVIGRNQNDKWLQIQTSSGKEAWIAEFLLDGVEIGVLPVKTSTAPTVTPAPTKAPSPEKQTASPTGLQIGDEVEGGGWRFKVIEVHKRKVVYFYSNSYVAQGHFLIVIIDAVNLQSGTDYFARNIGPYVTDRAGNVYSSSSKGSGYAEWQYGGLSSAYSDVNPGDLARIAIAYDIPDNVGDVWLSTKILEWIYLGNFSQMQVED